MYDCHETKERIPPLVHPHRAKEAEDTYLRKWAVEQARQTFCNCTELSVSLVEKATKFYYEFAANKIIEKPKLDSTI